MSFNGAHILSSQGGQPSLQIEQLANLRLGNEWELTMGKTVTSAPWVLALGRHLVLTLRSSVLQCSAI